MRIIERRSFQRTLEAQQRFLADEGDIEVILRLRDDLAELRSMLRSLPDAGRELVRTDGVSLRKLKLRRCPFIIWYARERDRMLLTRIYHARQNSGLRSD